MMRVYRREVEFEAIQVCHGNWKEICEDWGEFIIPQSLGASIKCSDSCDETAPYLHFYIKGSQPIEVKHGDWLVKAPEEGIRVVSPRIFQEFYKPIQEVVS